MKGNDTPESGDYLALYGTLMRGFTAHKNLELSENLVYQGDCKLPGALYDLGEYPGYLVGGGAIDAELYEILNPDVIHRIDRFEGTDSSSNSLYIRQQITLVNRDTDAWVYVYNGRTGIDGINRIESGSWREHIEG